MFDDIVKDNRKYINSKFAVSIENDDVVLCFNDEKENEDMSPFAEARYTMGEYLAYDDDLELAYRSNIAMFLNDRCGITDHEKRNQLARDLMNLLWG